MASNFPLATQQVFIDLGERSYPIIIGAGLLGDPGTYLNLPAASTALIVSNDTVAPLYAQALQQALQGHYNKVLQVILPDGEAHKDWPTLQLIFDALLANGCDLHTVQRILRHRNVATTTRYLHLLHSDVQEKMRTFKPDGPATAKGGG